MENIDLLKNLFDDKKIRVINVLLQEKNKQFYLREISKEADVSLATTFRIINQLVKLNIAKIVPVSKFKLYQIEDNEIVMFLASILKEKKKALREFINTVITIKGINMLILHGDETETKANLLIIGEDIDTTQVKNVVSAIKDRFNFNITYMNLTSQQYEQMSSIGLLPKQKKILFERKL